jgi:hypothetical protein
MRQKQGEIVVKKKLAGLGQPFKIMCPHIAILEY